MEPLTAAILSAIAAAASALTSDVTDTISSNAWEVTKIKLARWAHLDQHLQQTTLDEAIIKGIGTFRSTYSLGSLPIERIIALLSEGTPAHSMFFQALVEEFFFSAQPHLGRLADIYRRQIAFLSLLRYEQPLAWSTLAPSLRELIGLIGQAIAEQSTLPLVLNRAELQLLDTVRASVNNGEDDAAVLRRIEALIIDMTMLPSIRATVSAADGASINNAPVTIVMGNQHTYTIAPLVPADLVGLYRRYCIFISKSFGTLDFRGIVQMQNVVRLRLEDIYIMLTGYRPSDTPRILPETLPKDFDTLNIVEQQVYVPLHTLVRDHPLLIVLGDPGAGKSTLVRVIMLMLAEGRGGTDFGLYDEWLPIFFPIAAFAEVRSDPGSRDLAPLAYLRDYYYGRGQPDYTPLFERALLAGRALMLLDGLDEVRDDRLAIVRCIEDFVRAWNAPGNRFLATSRIAGYEDAPLDDALFQRVTVRPFSDDDIRRFVMKWSLSFERAGISGVDSTDPELQRRAENRTRD